MSVEINYQCQYKSMVCVSRGISYVSVAWRSTVIVSRDLWPLVNVGSGLWSLMLVADVCDLCLQRCLACIVQVSVEACIQSRSLSISIASGVLLVVSVEVVGRCQ